MKRKLMIPVMFAVLALLFGCGRQADVPEKKEENVIYLDTSQEAAKPAFEAKAVPDVTVESYMVLKRAGAGQAVFLEEDTGSFAGQAKMAAASSLQGNGEQSAGETPDTEEESPKTSDDTKEEDTKEEDTAGEEAKEEETAKENEPSGEQEKPQEAAAPASGGGRVVCIDAGHQRKQNSAKEPVGPGASQTKMKVTSGTSGTTTGVPEYQLTLAVALKLQSVLQQRGYTVIMCRSSHDVDISNVERAQVANNAGAGAFIRIHADGSENASATGASTLAPSASNPYCANISSSSQALAKNVINSYCAKTGMRNRGMQINDGMTGLNWSQVPVTIIEMGFMTNPSDDSLMQTENFQQAAAEGMADGIDAFFAGR